MPAAFSSWGSAPATGARNRSAAATAAGSAVLGIGRPFLVQWSLPPVPRGRGSAPRPGAEVGPIAILAFLRARPNPPCHRIARPGGAMKRCAIHGLTSLLCMAAAGISAQERPFDGLAVDMSSLYRLSKARTRSISPENFTGEKGKGGMATEGTGKESARDLGQK